MGLNKLNKKGEEYKNYEGTRSQIRQRLTLQRWNGLQDARFVNHTGYQYDVEDLPQDLWQYVNHSQTIAASKYAVGFEIEKNTMIAKDGTEVGRFDVGCNHELHNNVIIKGTETDSSCGVEMVTNCLPLLPPSRWRNKIIDAFYDVSNVLDSPADTRCGGHIHVSVHGVNTDTLKKWLRTTTPLMMSLFKKRLQNFYCAGDLLMMDESCYDSQVIQSWHGLARKFNMVTKHSNTCEFRLPSGVKSTQQLIRRYDLIFLVVDYAVKMRGQFDKGLFNELLRKAKPILMRMYGRDKNKVKEVMMYARRFFEFMQSNGRRCHASLREYLGERNQQLFNYNNLSASFVVNEWQATNHMESMEEEVSFRIS